MVSRVSVGWVPLIGVSLRWSGPVLANPIPKSSAADLCVAR